MLPTSWIDLHNTLKIRDSIDFLLRKPNTRVWGGKLIERAVHRTFRKGIEFDTVAMDDEAPSLRVRIKKAEAWARGYFQTLSVQAREGSQKVGDESLNRYLIHPPRKPLMPLTSPKMSQSDCLSIPQPQPQRHHRTRRRIACLCEEMGMYCLRRP